ncbi:MAG: hypothetical protein H6Q69_1760 [Firmicutes bacterium]|nr:hypothetical protein [Bacillota bacterium]
MQKEKVIRIENYEQKSLIVFISSYFILWSLNNFLIDPYIY